MSKATDPQEGSSEEAQGQSVEVTPRQAGITDLSAIRLRSSAVKRRVVPFDFDLDGELVGVDAHEMTGGERIKLLDLARKLHEGKIEGGTPRFYREMLARVYRERGTGKVIWTLPDDAALIDNLPHTALEALMQNALELNGMDPKAHANAKNGSAPDA